MQTYAHLYIDGAWVEPNSPEWLDVIDPSTEQAYARIALGAAADVDRAVAAARRAFDRFSLTSREERLALLDRLILAYEARAEELAWAVTHEMGAPISFSRSAQVESGVAHLRTMREVLAGYAFEHPRGTTRLIEEPIGVCGLITPWNWPLNQIACKVAPALAAGCTMVLKPSEVAPISAILFAEIMHAAGVPAGVFNLVQGTGPEVGEALSRHPGVDMMSFTGSTRAGVAVAASSAASVKRVTQELGGKSANILVDDEGFASAVTAGAEACFSNAGQSCDAATRMLVPAYRMDEALALAARVAKSQTLGSPALEETGMGPVVSKVQFDRIQSLIAAGIAAGTRVVAGGVGRPEGLAQGYYVRPTVFGPAAPDDLVAREEIFGPVLTLIAYADEDQAVAIANDSDYGLAAYVAAKDIEKARALARRLRAGSVYLNYPDWDLHAPFGGYKRSGNGREYADYGLKEYLEIKAVIGFGDADSNTPPKGN